MLAEQTAKAEGLADAFELGTVRARSLDGHVVDGDHARPFASQSQHAAASLSPSDDVADAEAVLESGGAAVVADEMAIDDDAVVGSDCDDDSVSGADADVDSLVVGPEVDGDGEDVNGDSIHDGDSVAFGSDGEEEGQLLRRPGENVVCVGTAGARVGVRAVVLYWCRSLGP